MFRVFRSEWYDKKLEKLSFFEQERVKKFEEQLKQSPYQGKPLGYSFFREKKFNGKRLLFLIVEDKAVFLVTLTDKKMQREEIKLIKKNLDLYQEQIKKLLERL